MDVKDSMTQWSGIHGEPMDGAVGAAQDDVPKVKFMTKEPIHDDDEKQPVDFTCVQEQPVAGVEFHDISSSPDSLLPMNKLKNLDQESSDIEPDQSQVECDEEMDEDDYPNPSSAPRFAKNDRLQREAQLKAKVAPSRSSTPTPRKVLPAEEPGPNMVKGKTIYKKRSKTPPARESSVSKSSSLLDTSGISPIYASSNVEDIDPSRRGRSPPVAGLTSVQGSTGSADAYLTRSPKDLLTTAGARPGLRGSSSASQSVARTTISSDVHYKMFQDEAKLCAQLRDAESALQSAEAEVFAQHQAMTWSQVSKDQCTQDYRTRLEQQQCNAEYEVACARSRSATLEIEL